MVKHEDVDEENAQENFYYNMADTEDSSEVPGREESDDNNGKKFNMRRFDNILSTSYRGLFSTCAMGHGCLAPAIF